MEVVQSKHLPDVLIFTPTIHQDERGCFAETYQSPRYEQFTGSAFVQDNLSISKQYTLRGLHWQKFPYVQGKLVSCVAGSIYDVAVDIRVESPTFGHWVGIVLTAENIKQLWVPAGYAHGFQALEENTVVSYKCTSLYAKEHEMSLLWSDETVNVKWPFADKAIVSGKDQEAPRLKDFSLFF